MTDASRDRSASPRGTGTSAAEIASSPTQVSLYLACDPQAETDEQHVEPHDACDDECEHLGHGVPQKADEPRPSFGGEPDGSFGRTAPRPARQNVCAQGCQGNPCKYARWHGTGAPGAVRCDAVRCGAVRCGAGHRRQEGITYEGAR